MIAKDPKVSILCIAYNQEKFIRQTLESFVMQKTNFDFEIIIGDDCSTDGTREIIRQFEEKYPDLVRPIYREKNTGPIPNLMDILMMAKGKYVALCEGDDFFIDENKLQIQADFLDKNPEYSMCFHPVRVFFENNEEAESVFPFTKDPHVFNLEELLRKNFIQTNSVMYRKQNYEDLPENIMPGDWYLHLYHAKSGKIGFVDKIMSAYRRHSGGIWWNSYKNSNELVKKYGILHLAFYFELGKLFDKEKYKKIINEHEVRLISMLLEIDEKETTKLTVEAMRNLPDEFVQFFMLAIKNNNELIKKNNLKQQVLEQKKQEISFIMSSKFWKMRDWYLKIKFVLFSPHKFVMKYFKKFVKKNG